LTGVGWSLGVTSAHFQREELIILFLIVHLLLGIAILGLRCLMDKQVRLTYIPYLQQEINLKIL
jgi:hypothetical protein